MNYTLYDPTTGEILKNVACPDYLIDAQLAAGQSYVSGCYLYQDYYLESDVPIVRPTMQVSATKTEIAADNSDTAQISGVPEGASIYRNGEYIGAAAADGLVNVKSDTPKKIGILVDLFPYRPEEVVIHAS